MNKNLDTQMKKNWKVLITGGTGLIGSRLSALLEAENIDYAVVTRGNTGGRKSFYKWAPEKGTIDPRAIEGITHIIHLAGAGIADKRWTKNRKQELIDSRVRSARLLFDVLKKNHQSLQAFISAGGIGFYGDKGSELIAEQSDPANGFLSQITVAWEEAAMEFEKIASRVVINRTGLVLSEKGGILKNLKFPLKLGVAPVFGNGRQYYSWIHIDDLCNWLLYTLEQPIEGIYNVVSPQPVTNIDFIRYLRSRAAKRSIIFKIPSIFLKLGLGELSSALLISQRVSSDKMQQSGFHFQYPDLDIALQDLYR